MGIDACCCCVVVLLCVGGGGEGEGGREGGKEEGASNTSLCDTLKRPQCVHSTRPRWYQHHVNVWTWCRYQRERFHCTPRAFQRVTRHTPHTTTHTTTRRPQREEQRRQDKMEREARREKKATFESTHCVQLFLRQLWK